MSASDARVDDLAYLVKSLDIKWDQTESGASSDRPNDSIKADPSNLTRIREKLKPRKIALPLVVRAGWTNLNENAPFEGVPVKSELWSRKEPALDGKDVGRSKPLNIRPPGIEHRPVEQPHDRWAKFSEMKNPYSQLDSEKNLTGVRFLEDQKLTNKELAAILFEEDDNEKTLNELGTIQFSDCEVPGMNVTLLPHQVTGVRFLLNREGEHVEKKGGLLCDDMGLGKTIQTLALICKNRSKRRAKTVPTERARHKSTRIVTKATLILCPVSLITQWYDEIQSKAPGLKAYIFHGPDRCDTAEELMKYDVVISTYHTASSEEAKSYSPLFELHWWRVVLDEAHAIKNKQTKMAIAIYKLEAHQRWCLTGTAIQNNLDELQSLFKFLGVSKYSDMAVWKLEITELTKNGDTLKVIQLLRSELSRFMLRRTKVLLAKEASGFKLPKKTIHKVKVKFSPYEQELYENVRGIIMTRLASEKAIAEESVKSENLSPAMRKKLIDNKVGYMCILLYLLRLRQICCSWKLLYRDAGLSKEVNLPKLVKPRAEGTSCKSNGKQQEDDPSDSLSSLMNGLSLERRNCEVCMSALLPEENEHCQECTEKIGSNSHKQTSSAKMRYVKKLLSEDKARKTIIFSQFTTVLDLIEPELKSVGINSVFYTGAMVVAKKDESLGVFRNDPDISVLLCSLKCGSVGLNLTIASRVILFDPWWNPQIQAQAIDRVYRFGQTKEVDVYEITVAGSIEQNILELQEKKKNLADAVKDGDAVAASKITGGNLNRSELLKLFGIAI